MREGYAEGGKCRKGPRRRSGLKSSPRNKRKAGKLKVRGGRILASNLNVVGEAEKFGGGRSRERKRKCFEIEKS